MVQWNGMGLEGVEHDLQGDGRVLASMVVYWCRSAKKKRYICYNSMFYCVQWKKGEMALLAECTPITRLVERQR